MVRIGLAAVCLSLGFSLGAAAQDLPDTPKPQLQGVGPVTPGKGTPQKLPANSTPEDAEQQKEAPSSTLGGAASSPTEKDTFQTTAPELSAVPQNGGKVFTLPTVRTNFVEVPVTIKDGKGIEVGGLDWRDFRVYENGVRQHISFFSTDSFPLSTAFVIDQSLPYDVMERVNAAMNSIQGAFAPWDAISLITYSNDPQVRSQFSGAQSALVNATIARSKSTGRDNSPMYGGPMAQTTFVNGRNFDPNTAPIRNSNSAFQTVPKESHALNDAILLAAQQLRKQPKERRRIIYVVSDGKESGSKAKFKDVLKYLQTNQIAVYATLVGDSATWGVGWLDRFHIPFTMRENVLPQYVAATGGQAISGYRQAAIEDSFQKIATQARTQYTLGYYSHANVLDPTFRTIEVKVMRPNLDIISKKGYYPSATATMPASPQK